MDKQVFKKNIEQLTGETKQNRIANILNVSESKVSKWFSGSLLPTLEDLLSISQTFNCSIDWLIGNEIHQNTMSVYDVCKLLVQLDTQLYLTIESNIVEEPYFYYDLNGEPVPQLLKACRSNIYFCNSLNSLNEYQYEMDGLSIEDIAWPNRDSRIRVHETINNFLERYTKLKESYIKGYLDNESFNHMIEYNLSNLSKLPIEYYHINPEGELPFKLDEDSETLFTLDDDETILKSIKSHIND